MRVDLNISAERVSGYLFAIVAILIFAHLVVRFLTYVLGHPNVHGLFRLFDLGGEQNVPTFVSSVFLLVASSLLAFIGCAVRFQKKSRPIHWFGLAIVFLYLSYDEAFKVHEHIDYLLGDTFIPLGFIYYPWIIPYAFLCVLLAVVYFPFLVRLPAQTRRLFIIAGLIYVGGALGLELLESAINKVLPGDNWYTRGLIFVEEIAEMCGIVIFIYALLAYMRRVDMEVVIRSRR